MDAVASVGERAELAERDDYRVGGESAEQVVVGVFGGARGVFVDAGLHGE